MEDITKKIILKEKMLKRLEKEKNHYQNEIFEIQFTIEKLLVSDPKNYDIKKQYEFLEESKNTLKRTNELIENHQKDYEYLMKISLG